MGLDCKVHQNRVDFENECWFLTIEQDKLIEDYVTWQLDMENFFSAAFGFVGIVVILMNIYALVETISDPEGFAPARLLTSLNLPLNAAIFTLILNATVALLNGLSFTGYGVPWLVNISLVLGIVPVLLWGFLFWQQGKDSLDMYLMWLPLFSLVYSAVMKYMHLVLREGWMHIRKLEKEKYAYDEA